jgi:N-acetylmuramoyl-L-alanine amidase
MIMRTRTPSAAAMLALALSVLLPAAGRAQPSAPSPQTMYADAQAKEKAVRSAFDDQVGRDAILKAARTVVSDYERIVHRYPTSGYCDDALWYAGRLALDVFERFGEQRDLAAGVRLLRLVASEYPASRFARLVPDVVAEVTAASRTPAAPRPSGPPSPASAVRVIRKVERTVLQDLVRVTIEVDGEVPFTEEKIGNPDRFFVDLGSTQFAPGLIDKTLRFDGDSSPVRQIRTGRHPNHTSRVVLEAAGISRCSAYPLYAPYRLVIDCVPEGRAAPPPNAVAEATPRAEPQIAGVQPVPAPAAAAVPPAPLAAVDAPPTSPAPAAPEHLAQQSVVPVSPAGGGPESLPPAARVPDTTRSAAGTPEPPPAAAPDPVTSEPPARNLAGGFSIARQLGLGVSRIVIDPGHGGQDPGAKGRGITEAEVVLDVALRLEKLLQQIPNVEVILTRRADVYLPLEERTAMANRESADLFLSIHANASNNAQASGVETYFLNFATNLSAAAVAARENAASGQAMGALPDFVKSIALNNKLAESRDLATYVQRSMVQHLRDANKAVKDLGVKQAPFVVLIGAAMPSVLTEISFVTHAQEARLLRGPAYRQRIAEALLEAIRKYQTSLGKVGTIATGS